MCIVRVRIFIHLKDYFSFNIFFSGKRRESSVDYPEMTFRKNDPEGIIMDHFTNYHIDWLDRVRLLATTASTHVQIPPPTQSSKTELSAEGQELGSDCDSLEEIRQLTSSLQHESIAMEGRQAQAPLDLLASPASNAKSSLDWSIINVKNNHTEVVQTLNFSFLLNRFDSLPESLQSQYLLMLLRQSPLPVLRTLHSILHPTFAGGFLSILPPELVSHIFGFVTVTALGRACRVSKAWRERIEGDMVIWRDVLMRTGLWFGSETEANFVKMLLKKRQSAIHQEGNLPLAHPYKVLFKSRYLTYTRWITNPSPKHISFPAHGHNIVTCLLLSQNRIISASDDHSIHIYSLTTGHLLHSLDGHEGGVWALAAHENLLVSGSTDRTVRIWDLQTGRCLHVFGGHKSTVRCLTIVKPEWTTYSETGEREKWPKHSVVVTGSRDRTLRVWRLPKHRGSRESQINADHSDLPDPSLNPYHLHLLSGHSHTVRTLAARGRTLVSGSYDSTLRVWDISTGRLMHILYGHSKEVYSVVLDMTRSSEGWGYGSRAASSSMDGTIRLWSILTGECLHVLSGHSGVVGLLGFSPSFLVSAGVDNTLRVWDALLSKNSTHKSGDLLRRVMTGHTGPITCFQHDQWKVVSGSGKGLKVWDLRSLNNMNAAPSNLLANSGCMEGGVGAILGLNVPTADDSVAPGSVPARDLLTGITGVWQVAFEGRWCVSASKRGNLTVLDVWDFGKVEPTSGIESDIVAEDEWEREADCCSGWTWEDEEWVGEPSNGMYDHEDPEMEDLDIEHA